MNKFFFRIAMFFGAVALFASCADATTDEGAARDEVNLKTSNVKVNPASGSEGTISGNATASWTATADENDWFTISPESGNAGEFDITVTTTKENPSTDIVISKVTIKVGSSIIPVTITQLGEAIVVTPSITEMPYLADGTTTSGSATVKANTEWIATASDEWITIDEAEGAIGEEETLAFTVAENTTIKVRVGYIYLGVEGNEEISKIEITQAGADFATEVSSTNFDSEISGAGADVTLTIKTNTAWTISSEQDWISFNPSEGVASTEAITVTATIDPNKDMTDGRDGSFTIVYTDVDESNNKNIIVNQGTGAIPTEVTALSALEATLEGGADVLNWTNTADYENWADVKFEAGKLIKLDLAGKGLKGTIPAGLSVFTSLEYLDLSANELTGNVPASFEDLVSMTTFKCCDNTLAGTVPADVVNNPNYTKWDAMNNVYPQTGEPKGDNATRENIEAYTLKLDMVGIARAIYWNCGGPNWTYSAIKDGQKDGLESLTLDDFLDEDGNPDWLYTIDEITTIYRGIIIYTNANANPAMQRVSGVTHNGIKNMSGTLPLEIAMTASGTLNQMRFESSGLEGPIDSRLMKGIKYLFLSNCNLNQDLEELMSGLTDGIVVTCSLQNCGLTSTGLTAEMVGKLSSPSDKSLILKDNAGLDGPISADAQTALAGALADADGDGIPDMFSGTNLTL